MKQTASALWWCWKIKGGIFILIRYSSAWPYFGEFSYKAGMVADTKQVLKIIIPEENRDAEQF